MLVAKRIEVIMCFHARDTSTSRESSFEQRENSMLVDSLKQYEMGHDQGPRWIMMICPRDSPKQPITSHFLTARRPAGDTWLDGTGVSYPYGSFAHET